MGAIGHFVLQALNRRMAPRSSLRPWIVASAMLVGNAAVLMLSLATGSFPLSLSDVWATLLGEAPSAMASTVIWDFRLPRTIAGLLVGAFLAVSGAVLQHLTRNPLADPSLVGVSQGAALVVVAVTVLASELGELWRPLLAFAGALAIAAFIQGLASAPRGGETLRFILTGIGVAALLSSFTSALLTYGNLDRAMSALGWLAGSVHSAGWDEAAWLAATAAFLFPMLALAARPLSALRFGETIAVGLGVRLDLARAVLVTLAVALAAVAVAAVGPLGFVGLVAPHLASRLTRSSVGMHLGLTALTGAMMTGLADFVGRAAFAPIQIPAGLVTAIIGVPILVMLILRSHARANV